jgi:hypothetical protein
MKLQSSMIFCHGCIPPADSHFLVLSSITDISIYYSPLRNTRKTAHVSHHFDDPVPHRHTYPSTTRPHTSYCSFSVYTRIQRIPRSATLIMHSINVQYLHHQRISPSLTAAINSKQARQHPAPFNKDIHPSPAFETRLHEGL